MAQEFFRYETPYGRPRQRTNYFAWTLAILFCLRDGGKRFGELQKEMGVNPVTLTSRLKALTKNRLLSRRKYAHDKQSVSYELTPLGQDTVPIVQLIILFSAKLKR